MAKTEYKVGETFQFGLKTLKCVDIEDRWCYNCVFKNMRCMVIVNKFTGPCAAISREDRKSVSFIEVEETDKQE